MIGDKWFITGGEKRKLLNSTEVWSEASGFEQVPPLPVAMFAHCQVTLNESHVFLSDIDGTRSTYILDWEAQHYHQQESLETAWSTALQMTAEESLVSRVAAWEEICYQHHHLFQCHDFLLHLPPLFLPLLRRVRTADAMF